MWCSSTATGMHQPGCSRSARSCLHRLPRSSAVRSEHTALLARVSSGVRKMSRRRSLWSARRWRTICWAQAQRRIHHGTVLQYCKENSSRAQVELIVELIVELTVNSTVLLAPLQ